MNFLEERIVKDGIIKEGNVLKVDSFLNHQMDIRLFDEIGAEFKKRFAGKPINKILTIEASGIGIACVAAQHFQIISGPFYGVGSDGDMAHGSPPFGIHRFNGGSGKEGNVPRILCETEQPLKETGGLLRFVRALTVDADML